MDVANVVGEPPPALASRVEDEAAPAQADAAAAPEDAGVDADAPAAGAEAVHAAAAAPEAADADEESGWQFVAREEAAAAAAVAPPRSEPQSECSETGARAEADNLALADSILEASAACPPAGPEGAEAVAADGGADVAGATAGVADRRLPADPAALAALRWLRERAGARLSLLGRWAAAAAAAVLRSAQGSLSLARAGARAATQRAAELLAGPWLPPPRLGKAGGAPGALAASDQHAATERRAAAWRAAAAWLAGGAALAAAAASWRRAARLSAELAERDRELARLVVRVVSYQEALAAAGGTRGARCAAGRAAAAAARAAVAGLARGGMACAS